MNLVSALPNTAQGRAIGNQLIRSGTAVGANYRAACRGRSKAEFIAKLGVVEEEADESAYWMELIAEGKILESARVTSLLQEANELVRIMAASRKSAIARLKSHTENQKLHSGAVQSQIANRKLQIKEKSPS